MVIHVSVTLFERKEYIQALHIHKHYNVVKTRVENDTENLLFKCMMKHNLFELATYELVS